MQVEGGDPLTPLAGGRSMWGLTPSTSSGAAPATPSRRASSFFVKDKDAPILMPVEQGSDLRAAPRPPVVPEASTNGAEIVGAVEELLRGPICAVAGLKLTASSKAGGGVLRGYGEAPCGG